jgi:hypothetical protein
MKHDKSYRKEFNNSNGINNSNGTGHQLYGSNGVSKQQPRKYSHHLDNTCTGSGSRGVFHGNNGNINDYETYDRRSPAKKTSRAKGKVQLPDDVFYNPDRNMLYVKKGQDCHNSLQRSLSLFNEPDRLSSYSTNSSDEDNGIANTKKTTTSPILLEAKGTKRSSWGRKIQSYIVYFDGSEELLSSSPSQDERQGSNMNERRHQRTYHNTITKFGAPQMKNGPMNMEGIPFPTFAL